MTEGRIDPEQAWFWTREWQPREHEADEDLTAGQVTRYESDEQFEQIYAFLSSIQSTE